MSHPAVFLSRCSFSVRQRIFRRIALAAMALALGVSFAGETPTIMKEIPTTPANQTRTTLRYEADFNTTPQRLYAALTDAKQFAAFTGMPAEIDARDGGACSLFGGLIGARNIELVPNQRVVQAWRSKSWDPGVYSIVSFELSPKGTQTHLVLDHHGFAEGLAEHLDAGWKTRYLAALAKMFN